MSLNEPNAADAFEVNEGDRVGAVNQDLEGAIGVQLHVAEAPDLHSLRLLAKYFGEFDVSGALGNHQSSDSANISDFLLFRGGHALEFAVADAAEDADAGNES